MVSVSEENVSGIDTHFRKYRIGGIDTFGIVSPITSSYPFTQQTIRIRKVGVVEDEDDPIYLKYF